MKRLQRPLIYGILTVALLIGVATLVWAQIPSGFYVQYTASDTITLPAGVIFNAPTATITSLLTSAGATALSGIITPSQITANQNDYNPTGLSTASVLRLSTSASWNLTGLMGGTAGRLLLIHNVGIQNLVLASESASSTAANRFEFPGDLTLIPKAMVLVQYDGTSLRWHTSYPSLTAGPVSASLLNLTVQSGDPTPPATGILTLYATSGGVHTRDKDGNIIGPFGTGGGGGGVGITTVRVATTANLDLTGTETIDGISVGAGGELVLVNNQTTATQNGIYVASTVAWTRSTSFDTSAEFTAGFPVYVQNGTAHGGTVWNFSVVGSFTLGSTNATFTKTGPGPTGEVLANKNINSGYMGLTSTGDAPWDRVESYATHTDLSATSQIDAATQQKRILGIQNSGAGNVTLTTGNPRITGCTSGNDGNRLLTVGLSATKTVTIPNGNGVLVPGTNGAVVVGLPPGGGAAEWRCNGGTTTWELISYGGRTFIGHTNLASAYKICDTENGNCLNFYGSTVRGTNAGNDIDQTVNIPSTKNYILQGNGIEYERVTQAGVRSYSGALKPRAAITFNAGAIATDGTNCGAVTDQTLNGGPKVPAFSCADSGSSVFYGNISMKRTAWDAGPVRFILNIFHAASEVITFAGDFSAMCRSDNDTIDAIWGTAVQGDVTTTATANQYQYQETTDVTPNGPCQPGDMIFWRFVVDAATFSTNAANSKVLTVTMSYLKGVASGNDE